MDINQNKTNVKRNLKRNIPWMENRYGTDEAQWISAPPRMLTEWAMRIVVLITYSYKKKIDKKLIEDEGRKRLLEEEKRTNRR